jgi:hypothetical protein
VTKTFLASAILVLVASIAIPEDGPPKDVSSQEIDDMLSNMWGFALAAEGYRVDNGTYPSASTIEELVEAIRDPWLLWQDEVVFDDAWGQRFIVLSNDDRIEIRSLGSDGIQEDDVDGGMSASLLSDIVIRTREYAEFFQYPQEFCEHCPPDFCGIPPNTVSIDACNVSFTPAGQLSSFVETVVYRVVTDPSGKVANLTQESEPKVLDDFVNLDQLECCIERWVLLPNTEYFVSFRAGTRGITGTQWELRVCRSGDPCIQVNIPRMDYECNWLKYKPNRSVPADPDPRERGSGPLNSSR